MQPYWQGSLVTEDGFRQCVRAPAERTKENEQKRAAVETPDFYRDKWKEAG